VIKYQTIIRMALFIRNYAGAMVRYRFSLTTVAGKVVKKTTLIENITNRFTNNFSLTDPQQIPAYATEYA
jgi:hypothetical protein